VSWEDAIGNWQQVESVDRHHRIVKERHSQPGSEAEKVPLTEPSSSAHLRQRYPYDLLTQNGIENVEVE
jgi:hypothetical protein